jgi:hypothetical protein
MMDEKSFQILLLLVLGSCAGFFLYCFLPFSLSLFSFAAILSARIHHLSFFCSKENKKMKEREEGRKKEINIKTVR